MDKTTMIINLFGYELNLFSLMLFGIITGLLATFWRIQLSKKLEFTDMITKDGKGVSLTKVLQLIGGLASTWIVLRLGAHAQLSAEMFGVYLMYVASVEGFSKFISAKYGYTETSVTDVVKSTADKIEKVVTK